MRSIRLGAWALLFLACAAQAGVNTWSPRGPFGGLVFDIAIDPVHPSVAYASTGYAVYRSSDGGVTWSELPHDFGSYGVAQIQLDPADPSQLYVTAIGDGVLRASDGGATFTRISELPTDANVDGPTGLAISADGNSIYYSTIGRKFFRSTDGGASFSERTLMPSYGPTLIVDPGNSAVVYAAAGQKLLKTSNGGDTWAELPLPSGATFVENIALVPGSPNVLWLSTAAGVYSSSDEGASWSLSLAVTNQRLHSDATSPGILYASPEDGVGVMRRYVAGSWQLISGLPTPVYNVAVSAADSQSVVAATMAGVFRSSNGGAAWVRSDDGLDAVDVRTLATGGGRVYSGSSFGELGIGAADEGTLLRSRVAGGPSDPAGTLTITAIGAHPTDPNIALVGLSNNGLRYTNDGGATWTSGQAALSTTRIQAVGFDPSDPQTVFIYLQPNATSQVHIQRSLDGGITFTPVSAGPDNLDVNNLVIDPKNSARLFLTSMNFGGNSGIFRSVDSGVSWTEIHDNDGTFDLAIDPANSNRIYAVVEGAVLISDDGGDTFTPAPSLVNDRYVGPYAIAVDPAMPSVLYVLGANHTPTTEYFIMRSVDRGASWERVPNGSSTQWSPLRLAINSESPTVLLAATATHGVQSFEVAPDLAVSIVEHSGTRAIDVPTFFDVRVQNNGPLTATALTFNIEGPAGARDVSAQLPGGTCTVDATTIHCSLPFLTPTAPANARVNYTPPAAAALNVQANVTARERDPASANNTAAANASATETVDLVVTGSASAPAVSPNSPFTYKFQIRNAGPNPSSSTRLSINVDAGATISSVAPAQCSVSGATISCDFGVKASGETASVTVNATAAATGTLRATASATHATDAVDANTFNDSATVQVVSRTPSSSGGGGDDGGGGGGGSTSLLFAICLALIALHARHKRREMRICSQPYAH